MYTLDKLNNKNKLFFFLAAINLLIFSNNVRAVELEIIGNVIKGTCEVSVDNMEVKFSSPIFIPDVKSDINDKTFVKPFSLKYKCAEFDLSTGTAPYTMEIAASSGTSVDQSNKIYPTINNTKAAFVLRKCDDNKANCNIVDINGGGRIPFQVTANSDLESHFEVSIVQLGTNQAMPGELVAAVDITLLQP